TGDTVISAVIANGGTATASALTKQGTGTLNLSAANTYSGATTINGGTLKIAGGNDRLPTGTAVTLADVAGAILDLNGFNQIIGSLAGGGTNGGDVTLGGGTLTVAGAANTTYAGVISDAGNLIKQGTGALTLSGANTFGGIGNSLTLDAGTLNINNSSALGNANNTFIINGGMINNTSGAAITLANNYAQTWAGDFTFTGTNSLDLGTGAVTLIGSRIVTKNGAATQLTIGGVINCGGSDLSFVRTGTVILNGGVIGLNNLACSGTGTIQLITADLVVGGTFTNSAGTFDANGRAVTVAGLATISGGTYQSSTATQTFNGGLTVSGGALTGASGDIDVNGTLTHSGGTINAPSGKLYVSGDWTRTGGTFNAGTGTVVFDGTDQTISGSTTFNNLDKTVLVSRTLTFEAGSTQTITGTCTLKGAAGNLLLLRSSTIGTQWKIDPAGGRNISYVDVQDSNNINAIIINPPNSIDSGNNINWFSPPVPPNPADNPANIMPFINGALRELDESDRMLEEDERELFWVLVVRSGRVLIYLAPDLFDAYGYDIKEFAGDAYGQGWFNDKRVKILSEEEKPQP
ncbi:MAG: autotransporter-associated beta strand repeat-containing protein, partial [Candidatus Omnitrophica bacterium]|nr:autotransporter-associated beta strand repeat-containing protein [Candidatus Omnitrophota bacterium]